MLELSSTYIIKMGKKIKIKKLYNIIIENRYKISLVMIFISAIFGFFINNLSIKEWVFTLDKVNSLWWNIKFYGLLLASYELFYIITNNKNLSVAGTVILAFSGCTQYNFVNIDSLVLGELITILIYKILTINDLKRDIILSIAIVLSSIAYMFTYRPYAVAFGYVFLALIIFELIRNRQALKSKLTLLLITLLTSIISAFITNMFVYKVQTENISYGISSLFSYLYNFLLPFNQVENKKLLGSFISIFPLPMCLSLFYLYKNENHEDFLLPITIISVLETIYCISGFPNILSKITMFNGINDTVAMQAVCLSNLFIMFYFFSNIQDLSFKIKYSIRITVLAICLLIFIKYPTVFLGKGYLYLFASELTLLTFLFLNYNDKRYQKVLLFLVILLTLISGVPVNFFI